MGIGFWLLASGFWLLASGFSLPASGFWLLASGFWLQDVGTMRAPHPSRDWCTRPLTKRLDAPLGRALPCAPLRQLPWYGVQR